jgi:hypothetical protein
MYCAMPSLCKRIFRKPCSLGSENRSHSPLRSPGELISANDPLIRSYRFFARLVPETLAADSSFFR